MSYGYVGLGTAVPYCQLRRIYYSSLAEYVKRRQPIETCCRTRAKSIVILLPIFAHRKLENGVDSIFFFNNLTEAERKTEKRKNRVDPVCALEAYKLLTLIQQLTRPFQAFSFGIDADQRLRAGKADEQPGLVAKEEAKTICGIYLGHF